LHKTTPLKKKRSLERSLFFFRKQLKKEKKRKKRKREETKSREKLKIPLFPLPSSSSFLILSVSVWFLRHFVSRILPPFVFAMVLVTQKSYFLH